MNQLSWLLYWGNIAGNAGGAFIFFGICTAIITVALYIVSQVRLDEMLTNLRYRNKPEEAKVLSKMERKVYQPPFWSLFFCLWTLVFWGGAVFCPNQQTVYAIAASEVGERAITSPLAQKTEQALEAWLDKQIHPAAPASN